MNGRACILYRWWDADGNLLYIGKSVSLMARIGSHKRRSSFFDRASVMTIERYPDEASLAAAEVQAIRAERPPHNIVHNRAVEMSEEEALSPEMHERMRQAMDETLGPVFHRFRLASLAG